MTESIDTMQVVGLNEQSAPGCQATVPLQLDNHLLGNIHIPCRIISHGLSEEGSKQRQYEDMGHMYRIVGKTFSIVGV
jgi:hypothetical protein